MDAGSRSTAIGDVQLFATSPQSKGQHPRAYRDRVADVARWTERAGYYGILIYTDPPLVDPWITAQLIIDATERISPLVAVQPVYMHPYTVAKLVSSIGHVYGRRLYLNMVTGASRQHLIALGDDTRHDDRYVRLVEYTSIVKRLLAGERVSADGEYYRLQNVTLAPPLRPELEPGIFVSGSSPATILAARALGVTAIRCPGPPGDEFADADLNGSGSFGLRVGVIAREDEDSAWRVARERFPEDRHGQLTHALAMKISDSQWHRQLVLLGETPVSQTNPYWLVPFENYRSFCPYLVGSYDGIAAELARYLRLGFRTFILDIPASEDDLSHTAVAFERAGASAPVDM
jgi:alkanesulfonate monooxygenase